MFCKKLCDYSQTPYKFIKEGEFKWDEAADEAFQKLKQALVSAPILALPDLTKQFEVEIDASQVGIGAVLMHERHPMAYISKTLSLRNQALSVYDKELLAPVYAIDKWHFYLAIRHFVIKTDQKSLRYLLEQKLSTPNQFGWLTKLMG